jgi:hypothetical protein
MSTEIAKISRVELLKDVQHAIDHQQGFALGKIGFAEQFILGYLPFLKTNPSPLKIKAYETMLKYHCEVQTGVFPTNTDFLREFANFYSNELKSIDILGIFNAEGEKELLNKNDINAKCIDFQLTEPDRSVPLASNDCYLSFFKNKNILIISPFAELLVERSQKQIFEEVWSKIQKKWYYPQNTYALEIPYSYGTSTDTHEKYGTSLQLYKSICDEIDKRDFDVVLLGVGALALPLASYIKSKGKVAISLGGHLQVLFGVAGSRWKKDEYWNTHYINDSWIDVPIEYHPKNKEKLTDNGSYW